jgi:hypothetical protein
MKKKSIILSIVMLSTLLFVACDKQTNKVRAVARCVLEDPRLSTIVKDLPKAKEWVQDQRATWKQVRERVQSGTTPFIPDELTTKLLDSDDILARLDTCLGVGDAD